MDELKKYSPQYQHINDTLAFVVHLSFLQQNCKLIGLNEEQYLNDLGSIPQGWNKSNEIYQFRYTLKSNKKNNNNKKEEEEKKGNEDNKNTILVKILSMQENELLVTAVKQGSNNVVTLEIHLTDHINSNNANKNLNEYKNIYNDINALIVLINDQITNKVIPQKKNNANKNKPKNEKPNPLIFPEQNPNPNPLFIGGGRGGPFGGGYGGFDGGPLGGGNELFGPNAIQNQRNKNNNNNNNKPPLVPPNARFDPFGPGGPNPDHFKPPGQGRGGRGGFNDGLGGFGGGGFM